MKVTEKGDSSYVRGVVTGREPHASEAIQFRWTSSLDGVGGGRGSSDYLNGGPGDDHLLAIGEGGVMVGGPRDDVFEFFGSEGE